MTVVLEVRDLTIGHGGVPLLDEIAFDVLRGQVFAILGGSGCGKSTLLRTLIGLQAPIAGRVHFRGIGTPEQAMSPPQFGVLFQSSALFGSWTLLQNVMLPLQKWTRLPPDAVRAVALARLRLVGLEPAANKLPSEVSGGMRKRAGIARALALDPPILFLDEPSAGLSPVLQDQVFERVKIVNETGVSIIMVEQNAARCLSICDRGYVLDQGRNAYTGTGEELLKDPKVIELYLGTLAKAR